MDTVGYNDYEHRTAGLAPKPQTIQAWKSKKPTEPEKAQADIIAGLERAQKGKIGRFDEDVRTARMAYAPQARFEVAGPKEAFQFGDVVDVINPLHHLPIVGSVYRGLTNDAIGPMAQIVGGAVYGGPIGAVTGTVNAVTKVQTGKDMGDHLLGFAGLKTNVNTAESKNAAAAYARSNLDNMPPPEKIRTITINS